MKLLLRFGNDLSSQLLGSKKQKFQELQRSVKIQEAEQYLSTRAAGINLRHDEVPGCGEVPAPVQPPALRHQLTARLG